MLKTWLDLSLTCHKLVAKHLQVLLHTTEESIIHICLVDILQEIADWRKGEHKCINLEEQPALLRRKFPCIPHHTPPCLGRFREGLIVRAGHIPSVYTLWSRDAHLSITWVPHLREARPATLRENEFRSLSTASEFLNVEALWILYKQDNMFSTSQAIASVSPS